MSLINYIVLSNYDDDVGIIMYWYFFSQWEEILQSKCGINKFKDLQVLQFTYNLLFKLSSILQLSLRWQLMRSQVLPKLPECVHWQTS